MIVRIPDEHRALAKKFALQTWDKEVGEPDSALGPHIEMFKKMQAELLVADPDEPDLHESDVEFDKEALVTMLALSLGHEGLVRPWILKSAHDYPIDKDGWFQIHLAAAWVMFQRHERNLAAEEKARQKEGQHE